MLRFVRGLGEFRGAPRPRLILLELNPDDIPGLDVLAELKGDSDLMTIPVIIFSSAQDRLHPRQLCAAPQCLHPQARRLRRARRSHPAALSVLHLADTASAGHGEQVRG